MLILYTLSMCESVTDAHTVHSHQELICALSAVPSRHAEHTCQELMYSEHTGQELMRLLSASVKNSKFEWVPSNHAEHTRKELMLVRQKLNETKLPQK
jgi:hypothetical protein